MIHVLCILVDMKVDSSAPQHIPRLHEFSQESTIRIDAHPSCGGLNQSASHPRIVNVLGPTQAHVNDNSSGNDAEQTRRIISKPNLEHPTHIGKLLKEPP